MSDKRRKNTPEEVAAIYAAALEGKEIEYRFLDPYSTDGWDVGNGVNNLSFKFNTFQYRIKPAPVKPRVIYVNEYPADSSINGNSAFLTIPECAAFRGLKKGHAVRFIEDLNWKEGDPE